MFKTFDLKDFFSQTCRFLVVPVRNNARNTYSGMFSLWNKIEKHLNIFRCRKKCHIFQVKRGLLVEQSIQQIQFSNHIIL